MNPELTDEQTLALIQELSQIIQNDRYPLSPRIVALKEITWAATAGARSRAPALAAALRAAEQGQVWPATRLTLTVLSSDLLTEGRPEGAAHDDRRLE
jgi:hypothetical protein